MFQKSGHQFVEDTDRGISLEATGPFSFLYKDNDYSLEISAEPLKAEGREDYSVCLYLSDAECWETPQGQALSEEDRDNIRINLAAAMQALGVEAEIE